MRFMYQAAEERAAEARRHALRLLNPTADPLVHIEPACKVHIDLEYWLTDAETTRSLCGSHALKPLVEQYVLAALPTYIAKAVQELQAAADAALLFAKEHLESELNRVKALEDLKNEGI